MLILQSPRRSSLQPLPLFGHHKCGQCKICALTIQTKVLDFPDKGFSHFLTSFTNCKSCFCVYHLTCPCGKSSVGSTRHQLRVWILEHIFRIEHCVEDAPLVQHYIMEQHDSTAMTVCVLESIQPSIHCDAICLPLQKESYWIHRLDTLLPKGLNSEFDLSMFL